MVSGVVNPDEAFSKEHWMASFGVFSAGVGVRGIRAPKNAGDTGAPTTNSKVNSPDQKSTVPAAQANSATPKLPTLANIREWYRVNIPEMGLVQDGMGGYHFTVKRGDGADNRFGSGNSNNKQIVNSYNYWNKTAEFKGVIVYQRDDIINPNLKDGRGRTNIER